MGNLLNIIKNFIMQIPGKTKISVISFVLDRVLSEKNIELILKKVVDFLEKLAEKTKTKIDEKLVARLRKVLDV